MVEPTETALVATGLYYTYWPNCHYGIIMVTTAVPNAQLNLQFDMRPVIGWQFRFRRLGAGCKGGGGRVVDPPEVR
jgi:hypothetical protein